MNTFPRLPDNLRQRIWLGEISLLMGDESSLRYSLLGFLFPSVESIGYLGIYPWWSTMELWQGYSFFRIAYVLWFSKPNTFPLAFVSDLWLRDLELFLRPCNLDKDSLFRQLFLCIVILVQLMIVEPLNISFNFLSPIEGEKREDSLPCGNRKRLKRA